MDVDLDFAQVLALSPLVGWTAVHSETSPNGDEFVSPTPPGHFPGKEPPAPVGRAGL